MTLAVLSLIKGEIERGCDYFREGFRADSSMPRACVCIVRRLKM